MDLQKMSFYCLHKADQKHYNHVNNVLISEMFTRHLINKRLLLGTILQLLKEVT